MGKRSKLKAKLNSSRPSFIDQISGEKTKSKFKKPKIKKNQNFEFIDHSLSSKILKEATIQTQDLLKDQRNIPTSLSQEKNPKEFDSYQDFVSNVQRELLLIENDNVSAESALGAERDLFDDIVTIGEDYEVAESLNEKLSEVESQLTSNLEIDDSGVIGPEARGMYEKVKQFLCVYRSGPIPKAFKVIPCFTNWIEILQITDPAGWTAAAMYEATRIFVSRLTADKAQIFLNLVLLPRVRDDIKYYKKLNFHMFRALKKALFKPAAFFKGILLPLCCETPDFTLREATLISAVLSRASIPVEHSAAALIMLATTTEGVTNPGARNIVIRVLLDKRYALPYQAIDSLVVYFMRYERCDRKETPVVWHCALLSFTTHYSTDLSIEQIEMLWRLLRSCRHPRITPFVRDMLTKAKSTIGSTEEGCLA